MGSSTSHVRLSLSPNTGSKEQPTLPDIDIQSSAALPSYQALSDGAPSYTEFDNTTDDDAEGRSVDERRFRSWTYSSWRYRMLIFRYRLSDVLEDVRG